MKKLNTFGKLSPSMKEDLYVVIEDSGSGRKFYSDLIDNYLSDNFNLHYVFCNGYGDITKFFSSYNSTPIKVLLIFDNVLSFDNKISLYNSLIEFFKDNNSSKVFSFTPLSLEEVLLSLVPKHSKDVFSLWLETNGSLNNKLFTDEFFKFYPNIIKFHKDNYSVSAKTIEKIISKCCKCNQFLRNVYTKGSINTDYNFLLSYNSSLGLLEIFINFMEFIRGDVSEFKMSRICSVISGRDLKC